MSDKDKAAPPASQPTTPEPSEQEYRMRRALARLREQLRGPFKAEDLARLTEIQPRTRQPEMLEMLRQGMPPTSPPNEAQERLRQAKSDWVEWLVQVEDSVGSDWADKFSDLKISAQHHREHIEQMRALVQYYEQQSRPVLDPPSKQPQPDPPSEQPQLESPPSQPQLDPPAEQPTSESQSEQKSESAQSTKKGRHSALTADEEQRMAEIVEAKYKGMKGGKLFRNKLNQELARLRKQPMIKEIEVVSPSTWRRFLKRQPQIIAEKTKQ